MQDSDVIVVGSGAGGATFAYACARAGKSVLLLERGQRYRPDEHSLDERATLINKAPYDDRAIDVNGTPRQLYIGGGLGGSTALYGAALLRPSQDDFHPGKHHGMRLPRPRWDWPITYEDLEPCYTEAERLFGVSGAADDDFGPLQKPRHAYPNRPLPVHPINNRLMAANRQSGLGPFRLPLAIDPGRCLRCHACAGYICPTNARQASSHLLEQAGLDRCLQVLTNVEAESLTLDGAGRVNGVRAVDRATRKQTVYRARRYVLAAGAISSPLLLLRSGIEGPLIGRNYMAHLASALAIGIFRARTGADETFVKQVGFPDYYFGTKHQPHKLGLVQSVQVPGPLMTARGAPKLMPRRLQEFLRRRMLPLVGLVEDVPNPANRVWWGQDGRPRLRHHLSLHDRERGRRLGQLMALILKRAGAVVCLVIRTASVEHLGHQCGTLGFGTRPDHAVLGPDCRLFGHANVFVVDGSFLPTSLGVGPALTIAANALRVAAIVSCEL